MAEGASQEANADSVATDFEVGAVYKGGNASSSGLAPVIPKVDLGSDEVANLREMCGDLSVVSNVSLAYKALEKAGVPAEAKTVESDVQSTDGPVLTVEIPATTFQVTDDMHSIFPGPSGYSLESGAHGYPGAINTYDDVSPVSSAGSQGKGSTPAP